MTWPDGFTIWIPEQQSGVLLKFLQWAYTFRMSRKLRIWAHPKKKDPAEPASSNEVESKTTTFTK